MKKLYTKAKSKRFFKTKARKRKRKNRKYTPGHYLYSDPTPKKKSKTIVSLNAPLAFSFIENTDGMLIFFQEAKDILSKNDIKFDLKDIEILTIDSISVFIALIKDRKFSNKNLVVGNSPRLIELKELFIQSGFYEFVKSKISTPVVLNSTLIHKVTKNKVEPTIAKKVCLMGIKHSFGNENIFDPLYDVIIEIMQNTNNHAGNKRGEYNWWMQVYNDPITSVSKYTFLDLGVGIFESLPARNHKDLLLKAIKFQHNADLVWPLFNGEIKSRTGKLERGKGIPQVFESSKDENFTRFILISNNVYVNLKTMEILKLNNSFNGTFFYWELANTK